MTSPETVSVTVIPCVYACVCGVRACVCARGCGCRSFLGLEGLSLARVDVSLGRVTARHKRQDVQEEEATLCFQVREGENLLLDR